MLNYQMSEESSLSSYHLVTKTTGENDKVSFLKKSLVSLRVVTCLFKKTSIVTLKFLIEKVKIIFLSI